MDYPISLYFNKNVNVIRTLDLSRGNDDYRKVYVVDDGDRKIVIKHLSNTFSDRRRIEGWFSLMDEYRRSGLYCPKIVPNIYGGQLHCDCIDGREYYTYAEEYSIYETAENIGRDKCVDNEGYYTFTPDVMRNLGKIASLKLDMLDWPSAYCLLEPFCAPDTTDEATECAVAFVKYVNDNIPLHLPRAEALLKLFYKCQDDLKSVYKMLPTSCFQADLNDSNILLDSENNFVGLIDFNLCGKEPILNYAVREALWNVSNNSLIGKDESRLYFYDDKLDDLRIKLFLNNISYIQETYEFSAFEKEAFPIIFRYINSFWWFHIDELKLIGEDENKINQLFDWLERQMIRDDIRLT